MGLIRPVGAWQGWDGNARRVAKHGEAVGPLDGSRARLKGAVAVFREAMMSVIDRLRSYAAQAFGIGAEHASESAPDETLAAIALLVHVARADGSLAPAEAERLARLVEGRYAETRAEADALIARATAYDTETRDMAELVEMLGHGADHDERLRLVTMAWTLATADGAVHEFEEALVWRLGALLGLSEDESARARAALPTPV